MLDVFNKKQSYVSVITSKENASEDWNSIALLFLTSLNICVVFGYACFICVWLLTAIWLLW